MSPKPSKASGAGGHGVGEVRRPEIWHGVLMLLILAGLIALYVVLAIFGAGSGAVDYWPMMP